MSNYRNILLAVLLMMVTFIGVNPQDIGNRAVSSEPCPDTIAWTGRYRNRYYGFSILIPAGRKGFWNSGRCAIDEKYGCICLGTDHGRFIPLSDDAHIEAFTGFQMESEWSLSDYEKEEISNLKQQQGVEQVKVLSSNESRLGNLKARRFVVLFTEKGKNTIIDHIIALHKEVEYELILRTLADRYQRDRREFEKVKASWRLIPRTDYYHAAHNKSFQPTARQRGSHQSS